MTAVVTPSNLGADFDVAGAQVANKINVVAATTTVPGKVRIATSADVSSGTSGVAVDAAMLKSQLAGIQGGMIYQGGWNAATNTPQLGSGNGTKGNYYKVTTPGISTTTTTTGAVNASAGIPVASVAGIAVGQVLTAAGVSGTVTVASISGNNVNVYGSVTIAAGAAVTFATYLDGAGPFFVGDEIAFDGTTWDRFAGSSEAVQTVAGRTGAITLAATDVAGVATPASVTAQASVQLTDAFGNAIGHALP